MRGLINIHTINIPVPLLPLERGLLLGFLPPPLPCPIVPRKHPCALITLPNDSDLHSTCASSCKAKIKHCAVDDTACHVHSVALIWKFISIYIQKRRHFCTCSLFGVRDSIILAVQALALAVLFHELSVNATLAYLPQTHSNATV